MLLNDDEMMKFIDNLVNKENFELGNGITYHIPQNGFRHREEVNYEQMTHNLMMIYGDEERCERYIIVFDKVRQFVADVLCITGLERMFSQYYYNIEWSMYTEAKFDKNKWSMYRDHFVHQIRNAYLGYELIWGQKEFQFIDLIMDSFNKEQSTDFVSYIYDFIISDKEEIKSNDNDEENIESKVRIILFKTWFIAAFFHDIGYPLAHFNRYEKQIEKYMPYFRCFCTHTRADFLDIKAILADSYLFQMISDEELEERYLEDDHGMLSAICLLLNYYYTGTIHSLSKIDRCSIELAAYSIFSHTNKYGLIEKDKRVNRFYRPVFIENPLSFLLRICDDLQEWERMYFLIGRNSNILICKKCFSAIIPDKHKIVYKCKCGQTAEKMTQFNYRKINLISVCKTARMEFTDDNKISFYLDYDKIRLIEAVLIENTFAEKRYRELENLKKLLTCQSNFPYFEIKYFLSNNIQLIKCEILRDYLKNHYKRVFLKETIDTCTEEQIEREIRYLSRNKKAIIKGLIEKIKKKTIGPEENILEKICQNVLNQTILFLQETSKQLNKGQSLLFNEKKENLDDALENIYFYYLLNEINTED